MKQPQLINGSAKQELRLIAEACNAIEEFDDWLWVLKRKKTADTPTAWKRRLKKARDLMRAGQDMKAVWERSADSGWTGMFPLKLEDKQPEALKLDYSLARPGESMEAFEARMRRI